MVNLEKLKIKEYEKLSKAFEENKQVVYLAGYGTGRNYVMMKLIEEKYHGKKCLYIAPSDSFFRNLKRSKDYQQVAESIEYMNMRKFSTQEKAMQILGQYDLVVFDEAHYLGTGVFGRNILEAVRKNNVPMLGLTAAPVRNDHTDIRDEFPTVVDGIRNLDDIRLGLMPQFYYFIAAEDKDLKSYRRRLKEEKQKKLGVYNNDYSVCKDAIKDIAEQYPRNKYIVCSRDIASIEKDRKVIQYAFPDMSIMELNASENDWDEIDRIVREFNSANRGILMIVDFAQGILPLEGVDGMILMQNVQSFPLFQQMLGSVCPIGMKTQPLIIDCSARGIELFMKLFKENEKYMYSEYGSSRRGVAHILLGVHKEWADIEEFQRAWKKAAPTRHNEVVEKRVKEAVSIWNNSLPSYTGLSESTLKEIRCMIASQCKVSVDEMEEGILESHSNNYKKNSDKKNCNMEKRGASEVRPAEIITGVSDKIEAKKNQVQKTSEKTIGTTETSFIPRDIMRIALGANEEFESVEAFERAWEEAAPERQK